MVLKDIIGIATAIVVLAGISVAIINGGQTAAVIGATGKAFTDSISAATNPGRA